MAGAKTEIIPPPMISEHGKRFGYRSWQNDVNLMDIMQLREKPFNTCRGDWENLVGNSKKYYTF